MGTRQPTKEWFEQMCNPAYADSIGDGWGDRWRGSQKLRHSQSLHLVKPIVTQAKQPLTILDIGCAFGDFTEKVWKLNPKSDVYGIDIAENAVATASRRLPQLKFKVNALPDLDFPDNYFDLAICLSTLVYLGRSEGKKALGHIRRILKSGGYLLLEGPLGDGYFDRVEILKQLSEEGFEIDNIQFGYQHLYNILEQRIFTLWVIVTSLQELVKMDDESYKEWVRIKQLGKKVIFTDLVRKVKNSPFGRKVVCGFLQTIQYILRPSISSEIVPALLHKISKILLREKGIHLIIILAKVAK